jgi:hypothetical protein
MAAWPAPGGGQQLVVTSTASAYAYLLTLRSFFRSASAASKFDVEDGKGQRFV